MKPKKRLLKLQKRQQAWQKLSSQLMDKARSRYPIGYRCPGSEK